MSDAQPAAAVPTPQADGTITVKDDSGRVLEIRPLSILEELDLIELAGSKNSENRRWMMMATLAMTVRLIDGAPPHPAVKMAGLRARMVQVSPVGLRAVVQALAADLPDDIDGEVAAGQDEAKN